MQGPIYESGASSRLCLRTSDGASINPLRAEEPRQASDVGKALTHERLHEVIDEQRERMATLDSLLGCLVIAMQYGQDAERPPYYPDVAQMARELVRQSMRILDVAPLYSASS